MGVEPKGNLVFTFTSDPLEYKKECAKIAKDAANLDPADIAGQEAAKLKKPSSKEVITEATVSRPIAEQKDFEHILQIMMKNYLSKIHISNM